MAPPSTAHTSLHPGGERRVGSSSRLWRIKAPHPDGHRRSSWILVGGAMIRWGFLAGNARHHSLTILCPFRQSISSIGSASSRRMWYLTSVSSRQADEMNQTSVQQ